MNELDASPSEPPTPLHRQGGQFPPGRSGNPAAQFLPGQSGNPAGRPSAGAAVLEWVNALATSQPTAAALRQIADDESSPWQKRAAAGRMLLALERGDVADFERFLDGRETLEELQARGINTEVVKRVKKKRKILRREVKGDAVEELIQEEREIELHDRGGVEVDRILDRTVGKPVQGIDLTGDAVVTSVTIHVMGMGDSLQPATPPLSLPGRR